MHLSFFEILCKCGNPTKTNPDVLPLCCYNEMEEFVRALEETDGKTAVAGGMKIVCDKQAVIKIGINVESDILNPKLKRIVRHEIIHYFLWLLDEPWNDSDLEFWCYCHVFDGGAYQPLNSIMQQRYEEFVGVYDELIVELSERIKPYIVSDAIQKLSDGTEVEQYRKLVVSQIEKMKVLFHVQ